MRQTIIDESLDKERRAATIKYIAKFFYQADNAFNQVNLDSFKYMIEAIGQYGTNLKPPSYHEIRVTLNKEIALTEDLLKKHRAIWATHGCSIMSDGWTSKTDQTIINFLVNSPMGSAFIESVDTSNYSKTGEKIFELLNAFVDKIGEENIIQVITDNGSNFKKAGRLLEAERPHLYWTPCAAHCLDLMLEDIDKLCVAARTIKEASNLTRFIYNHQAVLSLIRQKIGEENIIQVITDNGSNFKKAGRLLEAERPHLYWTPCAAHCLDLMLEDIDKLRVAARTIKEVSNLTRFIYNHQAVLSLIRQKTKGVNLDRPATTRFATHYLSLKSIHKQKSALRSMILSEAWCQSLWSRDRKAKEVKLTILKVSWNNVLWILKVMGPLVRVLRLLDNEIKAVMDTFMKQWIESGKPYKRHSMTKRRSIKKSSKLLMLDGMPTSPTITCCRSSFEPVVLLLKSN